MYRASQSRRGIKQGIGAMDSRRKREEMTASIRKNKRNEHLQKRRNISAINSPAVPRVSSEPAPEVTSDNIGMFVEMVRSNDQGKILQGIVSLRKLLSKEKAPPILPIINSGVIPDLVKFLEHSDAKVIFESAWALTNIASGTSEQTRIVLENQALPHLVRLLRSPHVEVKDQAVWAIGNIAGDSAEFRNYVLGFPDAVNAILTIICDNTSSIGLLRNATWTLSNFCRGKPAPDFSIIEPAVFVLSQVVQKATDMELLTDACWALAYISDGSNEKIQKVIDSGCVPKLIEFMTSESKLQLPSLRTIGNIVTGNHLQTQFILDNGAIPALSMLLRSDSKSIQKETCWSISNIAAGTKSQVQTLIDSNILPYVVRLMDSSHWEVKKEACWSISNALSNNVPSHVKAVCLSGAIEPLCEILSCPDTQITTIALESLESILKLGQTEAAKSGINPYASQIEVCGGVDQLEQLHLHSNEAVYEKSIDILEQFFDAEEVEEENTTPNVKEDGFEFGTSDGAIIPASGFAF